MLVLFNNCRRRDHATVYGDGAFYDLDGNARPGHRVPSVAPGTQCVVATPAGDGRIAFAWFHFLREEILPDENDVAGRVFFGRCVGAQILSRDEATQAAPYCEFFDARGHFRQLSVICLQAAPSGRTAIQGRSAGAVRRGALCSPAGPSRPAT